MQKCPYCNQYMVETDYINSDKVYECYDCRKAFKVTYNFLGKILRKLNVI